MLQYFLVIKQLDTSYKVLKLAETIWFSPFQLREMRKILASWSQFLVTFDSSILLIFFTSLNFSHVFGTYYFANE